jgi:ribosome-binding protein aMBF1 (putative translation factor)
MKNKIYTFQDHLKESLKDPEFKKAWEDSELEYQIATQLIEARLAKKLSQRDLAKKMKTSQAVVSRIESMSGNPSISLLRRFAQALNTTFNFSIS